MKLEQDLDVAERIFRSTKFWSNIRGGLFLTARVAVATSHASANLVALDLAIADESKNSKSRDLKKKD